MYSIGVDLGGTNIAAGIVDENYKILLKKSVPTRLDGPSEIVADDISDLVKTLCKEYGISIDEIISIGIAAPGSVDPDAGVVKYANNLGFVNFPICALVCEKTGAKNVYLENDANAAGWGEAVAGAARGTRNSVTITLGTGVGSGVVIDGKVYSGTNFAAGELGHTVIENSGRQCTCGRKGCWEAYSSATALINMTNEKLAECAASGRGTKMTELVKAKGRTTGRTAFDAFRMGDAAAKEVVDMYIEYLACGLVNTINIFQPDVLCIGGGVSGEGQFLMDLLMPQIEKFSYGGKENGSVKVCIAELGNDAGIIGGALLGLKK